MDILVAIPSPGRLLVHVQNDPAHPDHAITKEIVDLLAQSHDANGKVWEITPIPAPAVLRDSESWVDYSYINHLVVNDGVIACRFGDSADDAATAILAEEYPGRRVVTVDAREIFARGGGIHCITQQQPTAS
ncbi:Putative agmatine deiminase [Mycobacteroides abscessus]|nr:porphyromonas-type peptidyl-arginine deiminase family protein [Mycobacteroides abscessus MAB_030201_1061]CPU63518.1 Putative agmatine deiminase [Mycobacteroides abscessus]